MWFDHSVPLDSACELCHSSLVNAELTPVKYAEGNTVSYQKDALIYKEMANRNQRFLGACGVQRSARMQQRKAREPGGQLFCQA
ncbi:uncharacterized protein LOC143836782 isoform X4 [Paroedura picta]|uniref:uncharacterized protein LOC143836782 isoform X4 n=1 Tax=Paroedura picta TaxID=143630 RepID=UPI0040560887